MTSSSPTPTLVYNIPEVTSGTTTSWIPLTSAWPSSAGCASSFFQFSGQPVVAWDPGYGWFGSGTPRCLPPAATTAHEQDHQGGDPYTMISIRPIVCPAAFTTAATSVVSGSSTQVLCCPSGYDLANGQPGRIDGACQSQLPPGATVTFLSRSSSNIAYAQTTNVFTDATMITGIAITGWNVNEPTHSPSSPPACTSSDTATCNNGLSAGAKGGIGVGAAVGAIGLIALAIAFFLLKRRPKEGAYYSNLPPTPLHDVKGANGGPLHEVGEQPNMGPHEIGDQNRAAELPVR